MLGCLGGAVVLNITCSAETVAIMSQCTNSEYKSDDRPAKCDYQDCICSSSLFDERECEVRRKGSSSWRPMGRLPSYKIKLKKGSDGEKRVSFSPSWTSHKLTLHSAQQGRGEKAAYEVFRRHGVPASETLEMVLYFNDEPARAYILVETVSDKQFMKKHFGEAGWTLWDDSGECKESAEESCSDMDDINDFINMATHETFGNDTALVRFYQSEVATNHWDGACINKNHLHHNNFYLVQHGDTYQFVPWGLDQTMRCSSYREPSCNPVKTLPYRVEVDPIECGLSLEGMRYYVAPLVVLFPFSIFVLATSIMHN